MTEKRKSKLLNISLRYLEELTPIQNPYSDPMRKKFLNLIQQLQDYKKETKDTPPKFIRLGHTTMKYEKVINRY